MKKLFITFSAASLFFISCADFFQGDIPMDTEKKGGSLAQFFKPEPAIEKLGVSSQIFASQGEYSGIIKLQWSAVENAKSYRIERAAVPKKNDGTWALPEETEFIQIVEHNYSTVYTDTILPDPQSLDEEYGNVYYYRVQAENIGKKYTEGDFTDFTKDDTAGLGWLFAPPAEVIADKGKSKTDIKVKWEPVTGAASYRVYRGLDTSSMERIGTTYGNITEYVDTVSAANQGVEYYYKITAVNGLYNESQRSSEALGYALKEGAPVAPDTSTITNGLAQSKTSLYVTWSSTGDSSTTYSLFRTSSVDPVYSLIKSGITGSSYNDESVKPGIVYNYYIQTVNTNETTGEVLKSAFSETPATGFLLSPPSTLEAADGSDGNINIRWLPSAGASYMQKNGTPYSYIIYVSDDVNGTYGAITSAVEGTLDSEGYLCYEVPKHRYYKMASYNAASSAATEEEKTSILSAAIAPLPAAPKNVTATKAGYVQENWMPNSNEVYPVKITWNKPAEDFPAGYYVFRSTKPDSAFKKLTESPVVPVTGTDSEVLYYVDVNEGAKAGNIYYYKVVSLNSLDQGKKSNDPMTDSEHNCYGWGALTRNQWFREYNKTVKKSQTKLTLMHKGGLSALGSESKSGEISGTISYNATGGLSGAYVTMHYDNYADFYINDNPALGVYFCLTGNSDTNITDVGAQSGTMKKSVVCTGMYPGTVAYDGLQIKGGNVGGGYYDVETRDLKGNVVLEDSKGNAALRVDWTIGE